MWHQIPALQITVCVTLHKSLNFLRPQFSYLQNKRIQLEDLLSFIIARNPSSYDLSAKAASHIQTSLWSRLESHIKDDLRFIIGINKSPRCRVLSFCSAVLELSKLDSAVPLRARQIILK